MRIAVDGRYIQDHFPGIGRYIYSLCRALALVGQEHTFVVFYDPMAKNSRFPLSSLASLSNVEARPVSASVFSLLAQVTLPRAVKRAGVDVFHSPYHLRPYAVPAAAVVTLHDATPWLFPSYPSELRTRLVFKLSTRLAVATASRVIAVSQAARRDFCRLFGLGDDKVRVVYHGVEGRYHPQEAGMVAQVKRRYDLPRDFFLYVGINKPHKNLVGLIEAFSQMEAREAALVLAGPEDPRYNEAREAVRRLGLGERVRFLGPIDEENLPGLYAAATAFVFPSLYEGFGLPVLEAMACGTPVICSSASSLPEVVGDAGILVEPCDIGGWVEAMRCLLERESRRAELRAKGLARAAEFSWERAARATLEVYAEAVGR